MRRKSATRRARKVLPVAGRGDATMNTAVHGRGLRIGAAIGQIVADGRKHGLAMAHRHVHGLRARRRPCNSPRRTVRPTPPTVTYACVCDGYPTRTGSVLRSFPQANPSLGRTESGTACGTSGTERDQSQPAQPRGPSRRGGGVAGLRLRPHEVGQLDAVVLGPDIAEPVPHIAAQHERIRCRFAARPLVGDEGDDRAPTPGRPARSPSR